MRFAALVGGAEDVQHIERRGPGRRHAVQLAVRRARDAFGGDMLAFGAAAHAAVAERAGKVTVVARDRAATGARDGLAARLLGADARARVAHGRWRERDAAACMHVRERERDARGARSFEQQGGCWLRTGAQRGSAAAC